MHSHLPRLLSIFTPKRILKGVFRRIKWKSSAYRDMLFSTYSSPQDKNRPQTLRTLLGHFHISAENAVDVRRYTDFAQRVFSHQFSLLGSGWKQLNSAKKMSRAINWPNRGYAKEVSDMCRDGYQQIDWQRDFAGGYRWSEKTYYHYIPIMPAKGSDIKRPWELARMQHMPLIAVAAYLGSDLLGEVKQEFGDQILDFISTNPPRYGVNWRCTMDVAIRAANMLVAYDLLKANGVTYAQSFETVFRNSIYQHGFHIIKNLEWYGENIPRSNHYLADITGLLFVAAYLDGTPEVDAWLAFAAKEFLKEVKLQFNIEGSNVEGSTSYHRLSAEMAVYGTALLLGLDKDRLERIPEDAFFSVPRGIQLNLGLRWYQHDNRSSIVSPEHLLLISRIVQFTENITKPNGNIVQIGDNDSGRFIKLSLNATLSDQLSEDIHLNHTSLIQAVSGLYKLDAGSAEQPIESVFVQVLAKDFTMPRASQDLSVIASDYASLADALEDLRLDHRAIDKSYHTVSIDDPLLADREMFAYQQFGLYIIRGEGFFLSVRCGPDSDLIYNHMHYDQLAVELYAGGRDMMVDPGTFCYTVDPQLRNLYRLPGAHNVPYDIVFNDYVLSPSSLFKIFDYPRATCLYFGKDGVLARLNIQDTSFYRAVQIGDHSVTISDYGLLCDGEKRYSSIHMVSFRDAFSCSQEYPPFCRGYGLRACA